MELFDLTFSCYGYGIDAITTNRIQIVGNIVNLQGKYLWLFFFYQHDENIAMFEEKVQHTNHAFKPDKQTPDCRVSWL